MQENINAHCELTDSVILSMRVSGSSKYFTQGRGILMQSPLKL